MKKLFIEKDNYHDFIFRECAYIVRNIGRQYNDGFGLEELDLAFTRCAGFVERFEYAVIESVNNGDNERLYESLLGFVSLLLNRDDGYCRKHLPSTVEYIYGIIAKDNNFQLVDIEKYIYHITDQYPPLFKNKGLSKNFKRFYEIISYIVEDINDMRGWETIRKYYKKHVLPSKKRVLDQIPVTFLSYAFKDNVYALFLYDIFDRNSGFLYVDSLFGTDYKGNGKMIKKSLSPWINKSSQLLFLHSIHSDRIKEGLSSWCSWELGQAYKTSGMKFFKVVVAGIIDKHPIIDSDFRELDYVSYGIIEPKR